VLTLGGVEDALGQELRGVVDRQARELLVPDVEVLDQLGVQQQGLNCPGELVGCLGD